jgi:hypothetical protein
MAYPEAAKTLISTSGIAIAILATLGLNKAPAWVLQRSMECLVISIIFSLLFILVFIRIAEVATSRELPANCRSGSNPEYGGRLNNPELAATLLLAWVSITAFFWGFLYAARIVFYL